MKQYYRSASLEGLEYQHKYGLADYTDSNGELVMFGLYRSEDFEVLEQHQGKVTIVFQGSDVLNLPPEMIELIKSRNVQSIAISHWGFEKLTEYGLNPCLIYLSATIQTPDLLNVPNGDYVHFYSSNASNESARYLGEHLIPEIIKKSGIPIITTAFGMYDKPTLYDIYRNCFLNLRLTHFDGCPNTNLEMGLMGRKSVFNGKGMPASIEWTDTSHVAEIIKQEYANRKKSNKAVSTEVITFINKNMLP